MLDLDLELVLPGHRARVALVTDGPVVGIAGPSGSGKTTLLRVLAGLDRRAVGTVKVFGETWQDGSTFVPAWERRASWVPQDGVLFPHLSVEENLTYAGKDGLDEIVDLLAVRPLLERAPRNLSGGERQRVALGRALLSSPRLLLFDEPFSALDRSLRVRLSHEVAAWCRNRSLPVVLVSHDEADLGAFGATAWAFGETGLSPVR
jgi:molybdate transport system ATP-binding protein